MQSYKNNIDELALKGIVNGINKCVDQLEKTLGAAGKNVIIEIDQYPGFMITNDTYTILDSIHFEDPSEEMGRNLLWDSVSKANKQNGDFSTTTAVLTKAILNEGIKSGVSTTEVMNSLKDLVPEIDRLIDAQKKDITVDEVGAVASISGESAELGKIIQEMYQKIGKDGIVSLDNSNTFDTSYEIKEGVRFNCGVPFPMLYNKGTYAEYEKPAILITGQKISTMSDILPICEKLAAKGKKEIVIFADEVADGVLTNLVMSHVNGKFGVLIIKAPTIWKQYIYEDFAKVTGATVVSSITGINLKTVGVEHLGTCDKIRADKDETTVLGIKDVSEHIEQLKAQGDDDSIRRSMWLNTKAAVLKVGARSETELTYNKLKAEDAVNSARLALQDGVVAGGGVALTNVAASMPNTLGGDILREALRAPMRQIIENAGCEKNPVVTYDLKDARKMGFNAKTGEIVDMYEANILDAALGVKNAVRNAISVISTALTICSGIKRNRTEEEIARKFIQSQQGRF